uniref:Cyclin J like n=1 Tax=Equus asinus TaxID=9793 RepID=A0A9L0I635_EQUAS
MDEPWWEGRVASDVHCTLREKELKLPDFRAHSPLLKSRRFFVDILTLLSSHCQLCPAARHLAVYLLDHFLDHYSITTSKQLYAVAISCLLLASSAVSWRVSVLQSLLWLNNTPLSGETAIRLSVRLLMDIGLLSPFGCRWFVLL